VKESFAATRFVSDQQTAVSGQLKQSNCVGLSLSLNQARHCMTGAAHDWLNADRLPRLIQPSD